MANREFKIQSNTVSLNGVPLSASADNKVVIPGVTRASGSFVEEVDDVGPQNRSFSSTPTVVDYVLYQAILTGADESGRADFIVELDDEGNIDKIEVGGSGTYNAAESVTNAANDMYVYIGEGSASDRPIVELDWATIPFRPKMKATGIESEFGGGTGGAGGRNYTEFLVADTEVGTLELQASDAGSIVQLYDGNATLPTESNEKDVFTFVNQGGTTVTVNGDNPSSIIYHGNFYSSATISVQAGETLELTSRGGGGWGEGGTEWDITGGSITVRLTGGTPGGGGGVDSNGNFYVPGILTIGGPDSQVESHLRIDAANYWSSLQWTNLPSMQDPSATPFECHAQLLRVFKGSGDISGHEELMAVSAVQPTGTTHNGLMITTSDGKIPDAPYNDGVGTQHNWVFGGDGDITFPTGLKTTFDQSVKTTDSVNFGNVDIARDSIGWMIQQHANSNTWGTQTAIDSLGNVYVLGGFWDWQWDGDNRPVLTKYSSAGLRLWAETFQDQGSKFGGTAYSLTISNDIIHVTFTNWYDYNLVYVVKLDTNGTILEYGQVDGVQMWYSFYPRGMVSSGSNWAIAGELQQSQTVLTPPLKTLESGSTFGYGYWPRSYFDSQNPPTGNSIWNIKTTVIPGTVYLDFIYNVDKYEGVQLYSLFGSGVNADLWIQLNWDGSSNNYGIYSNAGSGYALGDWVYAKGTNLGCLTDVNPIGLTGTTWSYDSGAGRNVFYTTDNSPSDIFIDLASQTPSDWRLIVASTNGEYKIESVSGDLNSWNITIVDINGNDPGDIALGTWDGNIIIYNYTTNNSFIVQVTNVDGTTGALWSLNNNHGVVHNTRVKLDTTGGTDYGVLFEQTVTSSADFVGGGNYFVLNQATYPRWDDIQIDWTWSDGIGSGVITGKQNNFDGTTTFWVDGSVTPDATLTLASTTGKFEVTYSTNNNGVILGNNLNISWGGTGNQTFNSCAYGGDGSIYAGGYDNNSGYGMVVKFSSDGTTRLWDTMVQQSYCGWDYNLQGLAVAVEDQTEFVYIVGYDNNNGGTLYKLASDSGSVVWATLIGGYDSNNSNFRWDQSPSVQVSASGEIVVAGIGYTDVSPNGNTQIQVLRFNPNSGELIAAREVSYINGIYSRYEGDESDFQFVVGRDEANVDFFIASAYYYDNNANDYVSATFRIPLTTVGTFPVGDFTTYDTTDGWNGAVYVNWTNYNIDTLQSRQGLNSPPQPTASGLSIIQQDEITVENPPYYANDPAFDRVLVPLYGGNGGSLTGVSDLSFSDGSTQNTAYNPLMSYITTNDYWYTPTLADAGKFLACDNVYNFIMPDDVMVPLPIGWAVTLMATQHDVMLYKQWNNYPATVIVAGQGENQNFWNQNTFLLKRYGMATIIKIAANTFWVSGGTLEAQ